MSAYNASGQSEIAVTKGRRYVWTKGANDTSLTNDDLLGHVETLTHTAAFVAREDTVTLNGTALATITATLKPQTGWANGGGGFCPQNFRKHPMQGERRLFFVGLDGFINLYEYGNQDIVADQFDVLTPRAIDDELLTRGYNCEALGRKRWQLGRVTMATWDPEFTVDAIFDGVNEDEEGMPATTKSRTAYYEPFDATPYDITNDNDDHATAWRQNYAVVPPETQTLSIDNTGFDPDLQQESEEAFSLNGHGAWVQLRIRNVSGRCEITETMVEAIPGRRHLSVAA